MRPDSVESVVEGVIGTHVLEPEYEVVSSVRLPNDTRVVVTATVPERATSSDGKDMSELAEVTAMAAFRVAQLLRGIKPDAPF